MIRPFATVTLAALLATACAHAPAARDVASLPPTATPAQAPPSMPKLIVAISVDQYSSELFNRYRSSYTGGLRTLADGIAFPTGYQSHAATETCPGHSTILTGDHPATTGIVANTWFDAKTGSIVYCVSVPGVADPLARGPQNMRVTTLGDWVKSVEPGARSFAVSGKDRAAITMAGQHADGVYWWVDGIGFTTSSYAGPAGVSVTAPADAYDATLLAQWRSAKPALWPAASPDCAALAGAHRFGMLDVSGAVPPQMAAGVEDGADFAQRTDFQAALHASPLFDTLVADFAGKLIARERLGQGPATDVLAVSLSANDYVGHSFGNGGAEMCVQQAALDATIGRLMTTIAALHVPAVVVLTADHGATDAAERETEHGTPAIRIDGAAFVARLNRAVEQQVGIAFEPVVGDDPQQLYVNVGHDPALRDKVAAATVAWLRRQPEVHAVFTRSEIVAASVPPGTSPADLTVAQRFHESYDADRSGDIAVQYAARATFGAPRSAGDVVAGHGSPWDYDRQVPILFWWPGVRPDTRDTAIETVDIAPTLAAIAGVPTPTVDGRCRDLAHGTPSNCGK